MTPDRQAPLAERMRPRHADDLLGQSHLFGPGRPLRRLLEGASLYSMILWGPPGCGKTTVAQLFANLPNTTLLQLSAVTSGVADVRKAVEQAHLLKAQNQQLLLFVDEVHRFNKSQQDAFLPHMESGVIVLIGATTENPSFALNNALLSRARVYLLKEMEPDALAGLVSTALHDADRGLGEHDLEIDEKALQLIVSSAAGDVRRALGFLEICADLAIGDQASDARGAVISVDHVSRVASGGGVRFDRLGDEFYDQLSALHKSIRGSNPDAALYWMLRMLRGGCDPGTLFRRLLHIASEDIGNADPRALTLVLDAWQAFERIGPPEGELAICQAVVFLSVAAKSNAVYRAHKLAGDAVDRHHSAPVPLHLRNAPSRLARDLGHGQGYRYDHDEAGSFAAGQDYFPSQMGRPAFYHPVESGLETRIGEKLQRLRQLAAESAEPS